MFNVILMPMDGSPQSMKPLPAALDLARTHGAKLVFLTVAEPRPYNASDAGSVVSGAQAEHARAGEADARLREAIAAARAAEAPPRKS